VKQGRAPHRASCPPLAASQRRSPRPSRRRCGRLDAHPGRWSKVRTMDALLWEAVAKPRFLTFVMSNSSAVWRSFWR
jgi:hypothetical protein